MGSTGKVTLGTVVALVGHAVFQAVVMFRSDCEGVRLAAATMPEASFYYSHRARRESRKGVLNVQMFWRNDS